MQLLSLSGNTYIEFHCITHRPWNRSCRTNRLNSAENRSTRFPLFIGLFIFSLRNFSWAACFSSSCLFVCHNNGLCSWLLDNSQTCRLARSPDPCAKTTGRIELQFGMLIGLGQCHVRWVSHLKSAVRDVSWRRSLLVIKYFAALYLANGSSRRMVRLKTEHYTVLRRQRRIVNGLLQVSLPRVLEYSTSNSTRVCFSTWVLV